ncbi:isoleucine-tRNA ligase, partial [Spiromyces aspiralis]
MLRFSLNRASLGYVAGSEATPDNKRNGTNKGSAYSHTLRLPKTDFPQRANAARREALFRQRCTADLYKWQLENNPGEVFVLHDGPPYANGSLHTGHFLNKTLKDFINRYQILRGKRVRYRPGWDCHGLPIELKALEVLKGREKDRLSPREVRSHARAFALRGVEEQKAEFMRWGIMGEWDSPYLTLDPAYEANQLRVFYAMFSKGLIYRKNKPVYWSPSSKTALAEAELEYNDSHVSSSVYVRVPLPSAELERLGVTEHGHRPAYVLVWTTTPWTLPANEAIAVHPDLLYHVILVEPATGEKAIYYVVGSDRLEALAERLNSGTPIRVVKTVKGRDLCGCRYWHPLRDGALMPILNAGHVTAGSGTGLVHSAPGHGKEDYELGVANSLPVFSPVDDNGCFTHEVGEERLAGKSVLGEGSAEVVRILEERGLLVALEKLVHSYPYDWRTKKPIIQRATPQWFANVQDIQRPVVEALGSTRVIPEAGRRRLQAFIMGRKEWCISRQRSWGVPIPALYEVETGEPLLSKESISHIIGVLEKNGGSDAWWELPAERFVAPQYASRRYRLGQDTMDVWFDSGASWASLNSGSDGQLRKTQADVYLEGSDQHRGWFQSSLLTSYATTGT